jgi:hypothetical protein
VWHAGNQRADRGEDLGVVGFIQRPADALFDDGGKFFLNRVRPEIIQDCCVTFREWIARVEVAGRARSRRRRQCGDGRRIVDAMHGYDP